MVVGSSGLQWRRRWESSKVAVRCPPKRLWEEEEWVRARCVGTVAPVNEKAVLGEIANSTLEGNHVACIQFLVFDKTAPAFCHHVALAAVPVGVTEAPGFAVTVLEVQDEALVVGC